MHDTESTLGQHALRHISIREGTPSMQERGRYCRRRTGEQGAVLITALFIFVALAAIGAGAMTLTRIDTLTTGNYKLETQAFYAAEAGTEETRARLRGDAGANYIFSPATSDTDSTSTAWRAYIATATDTAAQAKGIGYNASQQPTPILKASLSAFVQAGLSYVVEIRHKTDADLNGTSNPPTAVVYWNGSRQSTTVSPYSTNVYVVTSYGSTATASRVLQVEVARSVLRPPPAALYVEAQTTVQGNSTFIEGKDGCGNQNLPGIATTLANTQVGSPLRDSIELNGNPNIDGSPSAVAYQTENLDIQATVNALKAAATVKPTPQTGTLTGGSWGTPTGGSQGSSTGRSITQPTASSCNTTNIVHFNTGGTQIKLAGGTAGCGVLLVEGDLNVDGGFSWYGPIIVTGSVTFAGGGNKLVTGAILSGGSVTADLVGGNANLVYCSKAITDSSKGLSLQILRWRDCPQGYDSSRSYSCIPLS